MTATALDTDIGISSVSTHACAKINLTLEILGLREDGFHELRSLVVGADLKDHLACTLRNGPGIELTCADPSLSSGPNLASEAARRLADDAGIEPALDIRLEKSIPVGAGLGGGSSDAAATLRLCNRLWNIGADRRALSKIGAAIGSDVPLFFSLPSAVMAGRGERVRPVTLRWQGWVVLVHAGPCVSTTSVYRAWSHSHAAGRPGVDPDDLVNVAAATELNDRLVNDLEPAVFRVSPAVAEAAERLARSGHGPFRVSGAGSALYRLYDDQEAARDAAREIRHQGIGKFTSVLAAPVGESPLCEGGESNGDH